MRFDNVYFINGTAYAGKSTMINRLAEKYDGILCEENYHDRFFPEPDKKLAMFTAFMARMAATALRSMQGI